jgi:hypothetical protein
MQIGWDASPVRYMALQARGVLNVMRNFGTGHPADQREASISGFGG